MTVTASVSGKCAASPALTAAATRGKLLGSVSAWQNPPPTSRVRMGKPSFRPLHSASSRLTSCYEWQLAANRSHAWLQV